MEMELTVLLTHSRVPGARECCCRAIYLPLLPLKQTGAADPLDVEAEGPNGWDSRTRWKVVLVPMIVKYGEKGRRERFRIRFWA